MAATATLLGRTSMAEKAALNPPQGRRKSPRSRTLDALKLASFVDPLPLPVLQKPQGRRSSVVQGAVGAPYYPIHIRAIECKLHRDLPPSRLRGYGVTSAPVLFEAERDQCVLINWINDLPAQHILPLDSTKRGMEDAPPTRVVAHMHGGRVPSISDGYPEDWFVPGGHKLCYYPNHQDATALWCHDHAMGVGRFNIFAGLMGWYLLRDDVERNLDLPSGEYELPLLLYDRSFDPQGQLYYPNPPDEGLGRKSFSAMRWSSTARFGPITRSSRGVIVSGSRTRPIRASSRSPSPMGKASTLSVPIKVFLPHRSRQRGLSSLPLNARM